MSRILVVTRDDELRNQTLEALGKLGYASASVATWEKLLRAVVLRSAGLVLVDGNLPSLRADLLQELLETMEDAPAVRVLRSPAPPLLTVSSGSLTVLARAHAQPALDSDERKELKLLGLGRDGLRQLGEIARSPLPLVIEGERGTGKKRLALWTHRLAASPGPFLDVENERAALPDGPPGTVYLPTLDARGPDALHGLAGRVRDTGWRVVGSARRRVDGLGATFTVLRLRPLRERPEDLDELARLYLDRYRVRLGMPRRRFDRALWALIRGYRWPGNVRELEGFVVQALTSTDEPIIRAADLPARVGALLQPGPDAVLREQTESYEEVVEARLRALVEQVEPGVKIHLHDMVIDSTERALIRLVLTRTNGNQKAAAEILGLARNTLHAKATQLGLLGPGAGGGRR